MVTLLFIIAFGAVMIGTTLLPILPEVIRFSREWRRNVVTAWREK